MAGLIWIFSVHLGQMPVIRSKGYVTAAAFCKCGHMPITLSQIPHEDQFMLGAQMLYPGAGLLYWKDIILDGSAPARVYTGTRKVNSVFWHFGIPYSPSFIPLPLLLLLHPAIWPLSAEFVIGAQVIWYRQAIAFWAPFFPFRRCPIPVSAVHTGHFYFLRYIRFVLRRHSTRLTAFLPTITTWFVI